MGVCCCLLITILWELPTVIRSLKVFSLVGELPGTVRNMMARLSDAHPGFLALPNMKMTRKRRCWESCSGFPGFTHCLMWCLIPNPFPCGFHKKKSIEAFEVFLPWNIPRAHILMLWTIVSHKPYKSQDIARLPCFLSLMTGFGSSQVLLPQRGSKQMQMFPF